IFYTCAFIIPLGKSVHSFFQPKDGTPPVVPPYCKFHFFNGIEEDTAKHYESTLTASAVLKTVLRNDAYASLPCVYLVTENDLALPAAYQEAMVELQNQRPEVQISLIRCSNGHSPHLAFTKGLVAEVKRFGTTALGLD
ncbi:hypothetical protein LSUE1_G003416, partial [Lachnellula suecica]